jgi:hypothetical protein
MRLLQAAMLAFGMLATSAHAKAPPCAQWGGVSTSQDLNFLDVGEGSSQSALVDLQGRFGPSWLQASLDQGGLRFDNKTQGVGLPTTIYHVQVDWLSRMGEVVGSQAFPEEGVCAPLSLFPGQYTDPLVLARPQTSEPLRVRLKIWASGP